MGKKLSIATITFLMVILLTTLGTAIPSVKAYDEGYGYASELYTTNWRQYENNGQVTADALDEIAYLFSQPIHYEWYDWWGWVPMGPTYGEVQNYGVYTQPGLVFDRIDHVNSEHSAFATVLYVGHGSASGFYGLSIDGLVPALTHYDDYGDYDIESHTSSSPTHHFVFMWVCSGSNPFPYGSITAWNPLYWSSQQPPYTWIGFENASPWLIEWMGTYGDEEIPNIYQFWLVWFYYYALHPNVYSVMDALNYASVETGFENYGSSILGVGYNTTWPYYGPPGPPEPGVYNGSMQVAGDPYGTYLPTDEYVYP